MGALRQYVNFDNLDNILSKAVGAPNTADSWFAPMPPTRQAAVVEGIALAPGKFRAVTKRLQRLVQAPLVRLKPQLGWSNVAVAFWNQGPGFARRRRSPGSPPDSGRIVCDLPRRSDPTEHRLRRRQAAGGRRLLRVRAEPDMLRATGLQLGRSRRDEGHRAPDHRRIRGVRLCRRAERLMRRHARQALS